MRLLQPGCRVLASLTILLAIVILGTAAADGQKKVQTSRPLANAVRNSPPPELSGVDFHVGINTGDIRGSDQHALQAAIDHVAAMGGGTVYIGPGRYQMRNALMLRDRVHVRGEPGKTVLFAYRGPSARLAADGDCNERQITLQNASAFRVGDGVAIRDEHYASGFEVTTATLTAQLDQQTFRISMPLYLDYLVSNKASASLAFPVVGGWNVHDLVVSGLTIEGNQAPAERLDGCRGGGIYLFDSSNVTISQCIVRGYNGDGISFQTSDQVTVEDCLSENNAGLGLHPGSGSQRPVLRRNRSHANGGDGLYVCWRVKHGVFEGNEIWDNKGHGISIGHKDTDNFFANNSITGNGRAGVLFRAETEPMGAHRNVFENNRILDNGTASNEIRASVVIRGCHEDLVFRKNTIGCSRPSLPQVGILTSRQATGLQGENNQFLNVEKKISEQR
jgi:parallel beta-helix repeat protein